MFAFVVFRVYCGHFCWTELKKWIATKNTKDHKKSTEAVLLSIEGKTGQV